MESRLDTCRGITPHRGEQQNQNSRKGDQTMLSMKEFEKKYGVKFTRKHTGKMKGMISLSTSPFNPMCDRRAQYEGPICHHCYSRKMMQRYPALKAMCERNAQVLCNTIIPEEDIPYIDADFCRLEAFGEITCLIQAINYRNFAKFNPQCTFGSWTKCPGFYEQAHNKGYTLPDNLVIGLSAMDVNKPLNPEAIKRLFPHVRFNFCVYTKEYAKEHSVNINCGARNCRECLRCYLSPADDVQMINELLK